MLSDNFIAIFGQGEAAWNRRRRESPDEPPPDLSASQFAHANLSGFDLHGVIFRRAYLRGALLRGACLREADLQGAYLIGGDLEGAKLSQARLVATNLNGANLVACDFHGADLREADCGEADLSRADFTDADLRGANLLGANLEGARFARTKGLSSRQLMAAQNWQKAVFQRDLLEHLDLPFDRASQESPPAEHPDAPDDLDTSDYEADTPVRAFAARSGSLDPILG
jgi:uncharacterized protein YjbI with pentapeptide repeats